MRQHYWWSACGSFHPWQRCPTRPDPGEVLLFYLARRGIKPAEYVSYLMDLLLLQKSMVYNTLRGEGFDMITRTRQLVQALKIPPPLLGIDATFYPIERHAYWWKACGYSFNADAQGYPLMSDVVAYLRNQRTQTDEEGRVRVWTQEDLGDASGLKKETVYRMEHDKNPLVLESMSRRAIMTAVLGQPPAENEATIYRLFGLAPQAYGVPGTDQESIPMVHFSVPRLTDEVLQGFQQRLATSFRRYYTGHAQDAVGEIGEWVQQWETALTRDCSTAQRVTLLALQSRAHRLAACIAREQCDEESILFHTDSAVEKAEAAMTLPNPHRSGERVFRVTANELLASAWFTTAMASHELGEADLAQEQIERALTLLPEVQSRQLKTELVGAAALIRASTASSVADQQLVISYLRHAALINSAAQVDAPDTNFFWCGKGMLSLYKALTLSCPKMKGAIHEKVRDLLEDAQRQTPPELIRRHTILEVLLAQAHAAEGSYQQATEVALSALEKSRDIRSRLNRHRLEVFYRQLLGTAFRDKPLLLYFGMRLRTWDYEMN